MAISRNQGSKILGLIKDYIEYQYFTVTSISQMAIKKGYITHRQSKDLEDFLRAQVDEGVLERAIVTNPTRSYEGFRVNRK